MGHESRSLGRATLHAVAHVENDETFVPVTEVRQSILHGDIVQHSSGVRARRFPTGDLMRLVGVTAASSATRRPTAARRRKAHRLPRHLHGYLVLDNDYGPFEFPGTTPLARPRGHLRPRVQPHPPVRLRRLPGRLVRRVDRDLDGGPGLQRHQRLPALRAALGQALRHAADRELDQGVRLGGLERVAGPPLRPLDHPQGLGAGDPRAGRAASRSPPTTRRSAPPGGSDFSRDFARFAADVAEWRTDAVFREGDLYPDVPRQGSLPLDGAAADRDCSTTRPSSCCGCDARGGRAVVVHVDAPRAGPPPAWPWSAGSAASATATSSPRSPSSRDGGA